MGRKEILRSPSYWAAKIQLSLYEKALGFMEARGFNRSQLASHLGVSRGYVTQLLAGDYDHRLSKFVELSLAFGYIPKIDFVPIDDAIKEDYATDMIHSADYSSICFDYTQAA